MGREASAWAYRRETKTTTATVSETSSVSLDDGFVYVSDDWGILLTGPEADILTLADGTTELTDAFDNTLTTAADVRLLVTEATA